MVNIIEKKSFFQEKRKSYLVKVFCFLLTLLSMHSAHSDAPIFIHGYELEFRLVKGGTTQYNALFDTLKKEGLNFELKISPVRRTLREFKPETNTSCIFPVSTDVLIRTDPDFKNSNLITSDAVDIVSLRVFTRTGAKVISDLQQLHGKKIAIWSGLNPDTLLSGIDAHIETTHSELNRVKMLDAKRIDVIFGFMPDVILAAEQLNLPFPIYDKSFALLNNENTSLVCKKTPENENFIMQFNQTIRKLKSNGELKRILGPHAELAD